MKTQILVSFIFLLCIAESHTQSGLMFFNTFYTDGQVQVPLTIDGLNFVWECAVSPGGAHVYTCGGVANFASGDDNAVSSFGRDQTTGHLTYLQSVFDNQDGGTADGLWSCRDVVVSGDGKHVYTAGSSEDKIGIFTRNLVSGLLTHSAVITDNTGGVDGIDGVESIDIDNVNHRLFAVGRADDGLAVFTRNTTTGALTIEDFEKNGLGGVTGLDRPLALSVSPDGNHVYVASGSNANFTGSDALTAFEVTGTHDLNFIAAYFEGQVQGMNTIDGLDQVSAVKVSPDGKHVYAACEVDQIGGSSGNGNDWISIFSRNAITGELTWITRIAGFKICPTSPFGADAESFIEISNDGFLVFVIKNWSDNGVAIFNRDPATGLLTFVNGICAFDPDDIGMNLPRGMALDPAANHLYVSGNASDALVVIDICKGADADGDLVPFGCDCDDNNATDNSIVLNGNQLPAGTYRANSDITSDATLSPGTTVFQAGDFVAMLPNFSVPATAIFSILIARCSN